MALIHISSLDPIWSAHRLGTADPDAAKLDPRPSATPVLPCGTHVAMSSWMSRDFRMLPGYSRPVRRRRPRRSNRLFDQVELARHLEIDVVRMTWRSRGGSIRHVSPELARRRLGRDPRWEPEGDGRRCVVDWPELPHGNQSGIDHADTRLPRLGKPILTAALELRSELLHRTHGSPGDRVGRLEAEVSILQRALALGDAIAVADFRALCGSTQRTRSVTTLELFIDVATPTDLDDLCALRHAFTSVFPFGRWRAPKAGHAGLSANIGRHTLLKLYVTPERPRSVRLEVVFSGMHPLLRWLAREGAVATPDQIRQRLVEVFGLYAETMSRVEARASYIPEIAPAEFRDQVSKALDGVRGPRARTVEQTTQMLRRLIEGGVVPTMEIRSAGAAAAARRLCGSGIAESIRAGVDSRRTYLRLADPYLWWVLDPAGRAAALAAVGAVASQLADRRTRTAESGLCGARLHGLSDARLSRIVVREIGESGTSRSQVLDRMLRGLRGEARRSQRIRLSVVLDDLVNAGGVRLVEGTCVLGTTRGAGARRRLSDGSNGGWAGANAMCRGTPDAQW